MRTFDPKNVTSEELSALIKADLDQKFVDGFTEEFSVQLDASNWETSFYNYARSQLSDWIEDGTYWHDYHSWIDIQNYLDSDLDLNEEPHLVSTLQRMLKYIGHWHLILKQISLN